MCFLDLSSGHTYGLVQDGFSSRSRDCVCFSYQFDSIPSFMSFISSFEAQLFMAIELGVVQLDHRPPVLVVQALQPSPW